MYFLLTLFVVIATGASGSSAQEVDCSQPPLHLHAEHCCDMPRTRSRFLECAEKFHKSAPPSHHMPPPGFQSRGPGSYNHAPGFHGHPSGFTRDRYRRQAADEQCFVDCLLNNTDTVRDDIINRDKAISSLELIMEEPKWKIGITNAVDTCINHINEFKAHIQNIPKHPETKCSNFGKFFVGCLNRHLLANCPTDVWNNSDDCNLVRKFIQTCDGNEMERQRPDKRPN